MKPAGRRWLTTGVVLAVLAVGGVVAWRLLKPAPPSPASAYQLAEAKRGDVVVQVTASGTLKPLNQVDVGAQVSGRIKELRADFNDAVTKGQLIAVIDPALFESAKAQAQARLESSKADLERAEAQAASAQLDAARTAGLVAKGLASDAEKQTADLALKSALAQVSSAKAAVTLAKGALETASQNLDYCRITAPVTGIVISRNVEVGQTVAASLQAPTLFVIAEDLKQMELHTSVAESDVGQLAEGQRVDFTVDAWPDQTFEGQVRQVRYAATTVSNVVTYDAVVRVENPALKLRPGMTANATFIVSERKDVLTVPNAALRYRPKKNPLSPWGEGQGEGKKPRELSPPPVADGAAPKQRPNFRDGHHGAVWTLVDGQPKPIFLETGLTDGAVTEVVNVLKGELSPGTQLITGEPGASAKPGGAPPSSQQRGPRGPPRIF